MKTIYHLHRKYIISSSFSKVTAIICILKQLSYRRTSIMNSLHILPCMCLLNYVYSCLEIIFSEVKHVSKQWKRCCLNKQTILTRPRIVFIGSVSNTKTEKICQQKLAVILCRIKWKNIDMQTDIFIMYMAREIERLLFCATVLSNNSFLSSCASVDKARIILLLTIKRRDENLHYHIIWIQHNIFTPSRYRELLSHAFSQSLLESERFV